MVADYVDNPWGPTRIELELDTFWKRPKDTGVYGLRLSVHKEEKTLAANALYTLTIAAGKEVRSGAAGVVKPAPAIDVTGLNKNIGFTMLTSRMTEA